MSNTGEKFTIFTSFIFFFLAAYNADLTKTSHPDTTSTQINHIDKQEEHDC